MDITSELCALQAKRVDLLDQVRIVEKQITELLSPSKAPKKPWSAQVKELLQAQIPEIGSPEHTAAPLRSLTLCLDDDAPSYVYPANDPRTPQEVVDAIKQLIPVSVGRRMAKLNSSTKTKTSHGTPAGVLLGYGFFLAKNPEVGDELHDQLVDIWSRVMLAAKGQNPGPLFQKAILRLAEKSGNSTIAQSDSVGNATENAQIVASICSKLTA
ncbi:hypothetical protein [Sandaracinus amylolyticus]|uniref:hypothetical protein n=1 Tax=Sandaracinus amylolyticus TaxID=927083 RepID=UPI001F35AD2D|nr:hypothetical protein [Sandaracinus amylolyticus]UJR78913.1 Hypothetical protein I5071_9460 [Sandaracinus amylolyticus]